jgi:hypothetical protein
MLQSWLNLRRRSEGGETMGNKMPREGTTHHEAGHAVVAFSLCLSIFLDNYQPSDTGVVL